MKRWAWLLLGAAFGPAFGTDASTTPEVTRADQNALDAVVLALRQGDCKRVVERLNEGMAARYTGIYLMAGTMYEDGLCLKQNWERALQLYLRASEVGHPNGLYKLVAGYAHQGRDRAAALWWAQRSGRLNLPAACTVTAWVHQDPESYVATLRAWPAGQLDACAYVAGVQAMVAGDAEYPRDALNFWITGRIKMSFLPAAARIEWRTEEVELLPMRGVVSGETLADQSSKALRNSLQRYLEDVGNRALRRFAQPAGVNAEWRLENEFVFSIR